jgi:glutaredoxin-related protein
MQSCGDCIQIVGSLTRFRLLYDSQLFDTAVTNYSNYIHLVGYNPVVFQIVGTLETNGVIYSDLFGWII